MNENQHSRDKLLKLPGRTKSMQLKKHLLHEIEQMLQKKDTVFPSEHQWMLRYQVSRQTVRKVLKELISEGYLVSRQGSGTFLTGLSPNTGENVVEILLATPNDYIFPELLSSIRRNLGALGFRVSLTDHQGDFYKERQCLAQLLKHPPRAILSECFTSLPNPNLDLYTELERRGTSLLFLYGHYPNFPSWSVVKDDNTHGAYGLVQNLYSRGHRHFSGIFLSDTVQGQERFTGFIEALRDLQLDFSRSHILMLTKEEFEDRWNPGLQMKLQKFTRQISEDCTALVCFNDEIAYGLLPILSKLQVHVPTELSMTSFDDSYLSLVESIQMTSLSHDQHRFSDAVTETLHKLLLKREHETVIVPWTMVEGNSVASR